MPPPRIQINLDSTTPVNRQIVDQLRLQLVAGGMRPGDALPSVRRLAIDLGIHFNTVADAYRTLAEEGWLDVSQGRAVRVRERAMPPASSETRQMFLRRLRQRLKTRTEVLGPAPAPLAKVRGRYRRQILLKSPTRRELNRLLTLFRGEFRPPPTVRLNLDVDPVDML